MGLRARIDESPTTIYHRPITHQLISSESSRRKRSTSPKINIDYLSLVRECHKDKGFKEETIQLLMNSWRHKTKSQYNVYSKRWFEFSKESIENPLRPTLHEGIKFLTYLDKDIHMAKFPWPGQLYLSLLIKLMTFALVNILLLKD